MHFGQRFQDGLHLNGRHILFGQHKCFEVVFLISLKCLKTGRSLKLYRSSIFQKIRVSGSPGLTLHHVDSPQGWGTWTPTLLCSGSTRPYGHPRLFHMGSQLEDPSTPYHHCGVWASSEPLFICMKTNRGLWWGREPRVLFLSPSPQLKLLWV